MLRAADKPFLLSQRKMKKRINSFAGSEAKYGPRTIEKNKVFLNSRFVVPYRRRQAEQAAKQQAEQAMKLKANGRLVNTELDLTVKTLLCHDAALKPGKEYLGLLRKDVEADEYLYDQHLTFIEVERPDREKRNPRVFNGQYITITRWPDGSYRTNLKPVVISDGFDIVGYATSVGNELMWGLEGLVGEVG